MKINVKADILLNNKEADLNWNDSGVSGLRSILLCELDHYWILMAVCGVALVGGGWYQLILSDILDQLHAGSYSVNCDICTFNGAITART